MCSLLYAVGEDARTIMAELGHSDRALSLRVYAHPLRYGEKELSWGCWPSPPTVNGL